MSKARSAADMRKMRKRLLTLMDRQLELLCELATGYYHKTHDVPVEVGTAIGAVAHRRGQLRRLDRVLGTEGPLPQNKKIINQYLNDLTRYEEHYKKAINACAALTASSTSSATPDD